MSSRRPLVHIFLFALLISTSLAADVSGEFLIELDGPCDKHCLHEMKHALKSVGLDTCALNKRIVTIKKKTWAFTTCSDTDMKVKSIEKALRKVGKIPMVRVDANTDLELAQFRCNRRCQR